MPHTYRIPTDTIRTELEIKHSRFIATAAHTPSVTDAEAFITALRAEHPGANHNCWSFIAGAPDEDQLWGMSDDGEPRGTAGRPMLNVLQHSGLGEITVVVTRYFGGIKLGTGGLARAYSQAVQQALMELPTQLKEPRQRVAITLPFEHEAPMRHWLSQHEGVVDEVDYHQAVTLGCTLPLTATETLEQEAAALTKGQATLQWQK